MAITGEHISLFLCGDVMAGRGIDQALPHSCHPRLHEPWVKDARSYVKLAEKVHGPIPRPLDPGDVWGDGLELLDRWAPDGRIINLETAVTLSDDCWPGKGIHYRMHPDNVALLKAARIDIAGLANNHVQDWGRAGLADTLAVLEKAQVAFTGAGRNRKEARRPAVLDLPGRGRILVFACGVPSSGIPAEWDASGDRPGIFLLPDLSGKSARLLAERIAAVRKEDDLVVVSIHWGGNWGFTISPEERSFARWLIDEGGVDLVHGHSSHHPKGLEVHREKLIIYGAGDLINDYEGISGYEEFRGDLSLMYFVCLEPGTGRLAGLRLAPMRMRNFRLRRATAQESRWLEQVLWREGRPLGTSVKLAADGLLALHWRKKE